MKPRRHLHFARVPASGQRPHSLAAALPVILLIALFAAMSCAPEEKEILVDPELPVAEPYAGGTWQEWPLFAAGMDALDVLRLPDGSVLLAAQRGTILHVSGESLENLNLPSKQDVIALAAGPQDQIFALDYLGQCFRRRDGAWMLDWPYGSGQWGLDVWCDGKGTVYVAGPIGLVMQEEGGRWTSVSEAVGSTLRSIWAPRDDDIWVVGRWGRILRYDGQTWKLSTPFGTEPNFSFVTGDAEGRLVLLTLDDEIFYFDTHVWQPLLPTDFGFSFQGVFVFGGKLHAFGTHRMAVWDGEEWIDAGDLPSGVYCQVARASQAGIEFAGQDGWIGRLTDGEVQTLNPELRPVVGAVLDEGSPLLLTQDGWFVRHREEAWQLEERLPLDSSDQATLLTRDGNGLLLAGSHNDLWQKQPGENWESLLMSGSPGFTPRRCYQLQDGTLLFDSGAYQLWVLRGDQLDRLLRLTIPESIISRWAVAGTALDDFWLLTDRHLWHYDGAGLEPILALENENWGVVQVPGTGLLLFGPEGLFLVGQDGTLDMTPQVHDNGGPLHRPQIASFAVTPGGDWLALDWPDRLLRRVDGRWEELGSAYEQDTWGSPSLPYSSAPDILAAAGGRPYLVYASGVLRYVDTATDVVPAGEAGR